IREQLRDGAFQLLVEGGGFGRYVRLPFKDRQDERVRLCLFGGSVQQPSLHASSSPPRKRSVLYVPPSACVSEPVVPGSAALSRRGPAGPARRALPDRLAVQHPPLLPGGLPVGELSTKRNG